MEIVNKEFLKHDEDAFGYPNLMFEAFYQQGLLCGQWRLPRPYIRQAYRELAIKGKPTMWQVRAFLYGVHMGRGTDRVKAPVDYVWPVCIDSSWITVVCVYPDGKFELDFVGKGDKTFWSETQPALELPEGIEWRTLEKLGFEIMHMYPIVKAGKRIKRTPELHLI